MNQYDKMIKTPIPKLIVSLGIPTTISMLVTNIYNMGDTFFVGRLGTSASGAIGIVFGFMSILQAFGFMLGQGAGSIISRKLGAHDSESASCYASISFYLSLMLGVVFAVFGILFIDPLLRLLGSTETILPYARVYVFFIMMASPIVMSSFVMNNVLRFEGKASLAMIGLVSGAAINLVADPILIFAFDMGIAGAGLATALSQVASFLILLSVFIRRKTQIKISWKYFSFDWEKIWDILSTGFPSLVRQGMNSISTMVLNHCAGSFSDAAVAAASIANRVNFFIFAVGLGVGQGFQPVCGYNYGAQKYSRVKQASRFTLFLSEILVGILAIVTFIWAPSVVGWFRNDPEVIRIGMITLRFQCASLFFQPITVISNMTFQSTGQRTLATVSAMLRSGFYFIPLVLILTYFTGIFGIQSAQGFADILAGITVLPLLVRFLRKLPQDVIDN